MEWAPASRGGLLWRSYDPVAVRWRFAIRRDGTGYAVEDYVRGDRRDGLPSVALAKRWAEFRAMEGTS